MQTEEIVERIKTLLERDEAMLVEDDARKNFIRCPKCHYGVCIYSKGKTHIFAFCPSCGQRLKWSGKYIR